MTVIEKNCLVQMSYTLTDESGAMLQSTEASRPFTYVHGHGQLLPGVERALAGLKVGDEKRLTLPPEQAHGLIDPRALSEIPKGLLPPEALVPGTELMARKDSGETTLVTVEEVREETVVLNLNHPLAGRTLHVHVRVLQVVPSPT